MLKIKRGPPYYSAARRKRANELHSVRLYLGQQRQFHTLVFYVTLILETADKYLLMEKGQERGVGSQYSLEYLIKHNVPHAVWFYNTC